MFVYSHNLNHLLQVLVGKGINENEQIFMENWKKIMENIIESPVYMFDKETDGSFLLWHYLVLR